METEKFTQQSVANSINYVLEEKENSEKEEYDEKRAFATVLDLERGLIDSQTLELFKSDLAEPKHFLDFLREETQKHIELIKKEMEKRYPTEKNKED